MTNITRSQVFRAALVALLLGNPAGADGIEKDFEPFQGVSVTEICMEAGSRGDSVDVRFVVENWSGRTITLEGINSEKSDGGELYFRGAFNAPLSSEGLTILRNETLNLSSSHIGARLTGLRRNLEVGDHIPLVLGFRNGTVEIGTHAREKGAC